MSLRILYVGNDLALFGYLQDNLKMTVIRCVGQSDAKLLIEGIDYSAVVLDVVNKELKLFVTRVRARTPVMFVSGPPEAVAEAIKAIAVRDN